MQPKRLQVFQELARQADDARVYQQRDHYWRYDLAQSHSDGGNYSRLEPSVSIAQTIENATDLSVGVRVGHGV